MTTRAILSADGVTDDFSVTLSDDKLTSIRAKFKKNYFGLPPYGSEQQLTPSALTYMARKQLEKKTKRGLSENDDNLGASKDGLDINEFDNNLKALKEEVDNAVDNNVAQRKVAQALLTMVKNEIMIKHFLNNGGLDAVLKLISETKDGNVLVTCADSLLQASRDPKNTKVLFDRGILHTLIYLNSQTDTMGSSRIPVDEGTMKYLVASILGNLTINPNLDETLVNSGLLGIVQNVLLQVSNTETMCFLLMSLSNVCPAIVGPDAELAVRVCMQITKKIDVAKFQSKAVFIADVYNNFSRINHYSSLLVDEAVIPLLLHLMDVHMIDDMLKLCTETLANLSINRKNRREISGSGIANRLTTLFEIGSPSTRSFSLMIMGNLLSSGLFYDKVANEHTISFMLENLLDAKHEQQFGAVCFCLSQLAKVESSCKVMVKCGVIPILLGFLQKAPKAALDNLMAVLVSVSKYSSFFSVIMKEVKSMVDELYEMVKDEEQSLYQRLCVVQICLNLSVRPEFADYLDEGMIDTFVVSLKLMFSSPKATDDIRFFALIAMTNFAHNCKKSRQVILGRDLIELMQDVGITDDRLNVKYAGLLNIISNEESCIYKLLELGTQRLVVSMQDSFNRLELTNKKDKTTSSKKTFKKGQGTKALSELLNTNSLQLTSNASNTNEENANPTSSNSLRDISEGELGKALSAAILHNMALKRPTLAPGVLITLLNLAKNNTSLRVLHCVRSLSNMTTHPKAKVSLNKEAKRLIPLLTVIMRCGCEEAEKVQYYCAVALCNIFSGNIERSSLTDMIKSTTTVDLVVVTLLRINSAATKEILCKAFFNMLSRTDIRPTLVVQLDMLAAVMELCKVEYLELFELCVRILYNITCELHPSAPEQEQYSKKLVSLKLCHFCIDRLRYKPGYEKQGSTTNKTIRILMGMTLANMSFIKPLVVDMSKNGKLISEAMSRVCAIHS